MPLFTVIADKPGSARLTMSSAAAWRLIISVLFVAWTTGYWWAKSLGEDFTSIYFGARVYGTHALYAAELTDFPTGDDPTWKHVIDQTDYPGGRWHPYVHIPLLARTLAPIFTRIDYQSALRLMVLINAICLVVIVFTAAKLACRALLRPVPFALALIVFASTTPVQSAMDFAQTTPVIVAATLAALVLADRRPMVAGILLAAVTAVKLSPVLLVAVLVFLPRQRRAAMYAAIFGIVIGTINLLVCGASLTKEWISTALRASKSALFMDVNQNPTTALISAAHPHTQMGAGIPLITPIWVKVTVLAITLTCTAFAYLVWRKLGPAGRLSLGASWALCFIPLVTVAISWNHYHIVMVFLVAQLLGLAYATPPSHARELIVGGAIITVLLEMLPWSTAPLLPSLANSQLTAGGAWVATFGFLALTAAHATSARTTTTPLRATEPIRT